MLLRCLENYIFHSPPFGYTLSDLAHKEKLLSNNNKSMELLTWLLLDWGKPNTGITPKRSGQQQNILLEGFGVGWGGIFSREC